MTMPQGPGGPQGYQGPQQGPPSQPGPVLANQPTQHLPVPGSGSPGANPQGSWPPGSGPWPQGQAGHPQGGPPTVQGTQPGGPGGPPVQFGPPSTTGHPRPQAATAIWILGAVSVVAIVAGLSIDENGRNAWDTVNAWGGLAIVGALLTMAPALGTASISTARAWQISACGAGALVLFWVLFVLPAAGSNTSLAVTVGVAAGVIATWIAPGRDQHAGELTDRSDQPRKNTW
ncbi:MAG: hypothetical protein ABI345_06330 [Jatrophihabitans sp.]